ncbi:unnamed protein product [Brassica rapa]|uniref:Uncharacterized protein n=1 Tax=Brassica campestris TaxID=3711 RepID=A0A8D9D561_BRACM|nr:unnamed protein product [Brassica rapa]
MDVLPRGPKSPEQSTGRVSMLIPRTNVLICVLMDSHGRPVCADGQTRTHTDSHRRPVCAVGQPHTFTDVLCVLADTHGRPLCTEQTAHMGQNHPNSPQEGPGVNILSPRTNMLICVLIDSHGRPVCADGDTRTVPDVLCVLTDTHRCPVCAGGHPRTSCDQRADICTDGQPRTSCPRMSGVCWRTPTDVLCVLNRQPTWAKITRTVHGKGQRAESKDQRADMCTDGQPRTSSTDVLCVQTNTHGRPVCADGHPRTQPTWAKITRTVHGKGQRAESKDQRADMCTDGQPRTSYIPRGPKSPEQSTGRVSVLSPRTNVLICVLMDSHGRPMCTDGHTRTHADSPGRPVQPTWAKITQTVHKKGQGAESKDQRADMCTDGQPRTSCPQTATDVMCVLADTHGFSVCTEQTSHPRTSCVCWRTPTDVLCVLTRQPTWAKITRTVDMKGQHSESKDQHADMCTDRQSQTSCVHTWTATDVLCVLMDTHGRPMCANGHPRTSSTDSPGPTDVRCVLADTHGCPVCTEQTAHVGQNHPNSPREGSTC